MVPPFICPRCEGLVSAATVTAVAAVAAAITATAVAAEAATTIAAAETTASWARRAITLGASEGYGERTAIHFLAIPTVDCRLGLRLGSHLDEAEAARATRHAVSNNARGDDVSSLFKGLLHIILGRAIGDTAHVELVPLDTCCLIHVDREID